MPHLAVDAEVERMKGNTKLTELDRQELELRARYARIWLDRAASDDYKFTLQDILPDAAKQLSSEQKTAIGKVVAYVQEHATLDGQELHTALHEIRKESGLSAGEFFGALYLAFLGKDHGPKAGWFLSVLDRDFVLTRLGEIINS